MGSSWCARKTGSFARGTSLRCGHRDLRFGADGLIFETRGLVLETRGAWRRWNAGRRATAGGQGAGSRAPGRPATARSALDCGASAPLCHLVLPSAQFTTVLDAFPKPVEPRMARSTRSRTGRAPLRRRRGFFPIAGRRSHAKAPSRPVCHPAFTFWRLGVSGGRFPSFP